MHADMLIDGEFMAGEGEAVPVFDAQTGKALVRIPEASPVQVERVVEGAARAFPAWSQATPAERSALLLRFADAIEARVDHFARLESQDCGKPLARILEDEIPAIVDCYRFFAGAVPIRALPSP